MEREASKLVRWPRSAHIFTAIVAVSLQGMDAVAQSVKRDDTSVMPKRIGPPSPTAQEAYEHEKRLALIVGVGVYSDSRNNFADLQYAERDAQAVAKVFEDNKFRTDVLLGADATKENVERAVERLAREANGTQGLVVFYFTGHGFEVDGANYLATHDATETALASTGISVSWVRDKLSKSGSKRQLMLIDACRANVQRGVMGADNRSFAALDKSEGLYVFHSTRPGGLAYEDKNLKHSVFTYYLLRALRGQAAGEDGLITFMDIRDYVTRWLLKYAETVKRLPEQVPFVAGEGTGDFYIAKAAQSPLSQPSSVRQRIYVVASERQGVLNPTDGAHYAWVAPGKFEMGCGRSDTSCAEDELRHKVEISRGFWIAQTEVTRRAYRRFVQQTGRKMPPTAPFAESDDHPIVGVNWKDAEEFCRWTGGRLPTEAEWEYAASRVDVNHRKSLDAIAWFANNSGKANVNADQIMSNDGVNFTLRLRGNGGGTHPVGTKWPTQDGIFDLLGNAWEWCLDVYDEYPSGDSIDPEGPVRGITRVLRGGGWDSVGAEVRISKRFKLQPDRGGEDIGFRCVGQTLPEEQ